MKYVRIAYSVDSILDSVRICCSILVRTIYAVVPGNRMLSTANSISEAAGRREAMPKYELLKREVLQAIENGELEIGQKLLPESELAERHGIARSTVRQALGELESMGVVRRTPRRGTEIIGAPSTMAGEQIHTFGLVLPEIQSGQYISLQRSVLESTRSQAGQVVVCDSGQEVSRQLDALVRMISSDVGGIIVVPVSRQATPAYHFAVARRVNVPLVFCHRNVEGVTAPLVTFSGYEIGLKAGEVLRDHGHRHVMFWSAHAGPVCDMYLRGLRDVMAGVDAARVSCYDADVYQCPDVTPELIERELVELKKIMAGSEPPTAVFASCDSEADRVASHLESLGYRVPHDISLMTFGDSQRVTPRQRQISAVTVSENLIGEVASRVLSELVSGVRSRDNAETIIVDCQVSIGSTVAPRKS